MTQQATFTRRAVRDCQRIGVDEDEARDVLDSPDYVRESPDPGDPETVFVYSVRGVDQDLALVVTWQQLADRRLVRRVSLLRRDEFA